MNVLQLVARFNANSDRANLNCNRNPSNTNARLGITCTLGLIVKTHKNVYEQLCSCDNLELAYKKARRGKAKKLAVEEFDKNFYVNLRQLQYELEKQIYEPLPLKRFIVRDPKTRTIHASAFRDRIVHHALINMLEPIFDKKFIHDSYASRKNKGTHPAVQRFELFMRRVSKNGRCIKKKYSNNSIQGYIFKADIKHYFDTVSHAVLVGIIRRKIKDPSIIALIKKILDNFESPKPGRGMPLGNFTSQFFANVYLNELDYFVKHILKATYYIRYVDDFVILHHRKKLLENYKDRIVRYLTYLKLEIHPDKSQIIPLCKGITFLGYRIFYHYKLLRKRNIRSFQRKYKHQLELYKEGFLSQAQLIEQLQGWFGYAQWANTYKMRQDILRTIGGG